MQRMMITYAYGNLTVFFSSTTSNKSKLFSPYQFHGKCETWVRHCVDTFFGIINATMRNGRHSMESDRMMQTFFLIRNDSLNDNGSDHRWLLTKSPVRPIRGMPAHPNMWFHCCRSANFATTWHLWMSFDRWFATDYAINLCWNYEINEFFFSILTDESFVKNIFPIQFSFF